MRAVPSAGDPQWYQHAACFGRLTPACTHMSDCTRHFLVNSRELIGLLLLLACIFKSLLPLAVRIISIINLVKIACLTYVGCRNHYICIIICRSFGLCSSASSSTFDRMFIGFLSSILQSLLLAIRPCP